jgi:hypothetical protein
MFSAGGNRFGCEGTGFLISPLPDPSALPAAMTLPLSTPIASTDIKTLRLCNFMNI